MAFRLGDGSGAMVFAEEAVPAFRVVLDENPVHPFVDVFGDVVAVFDDDLFLDHVVTRSLHQLVFFDAMAAGSFGGHGTGTGVGLGGGDEAESQG